MTLIGYHFAQMQVAARIKLCVAATWAVLGMSLAATAGAAPSWLAPVDLSPQASGIFQFGAQIAVDPRGDVVALWSRFDLGHGQSVIQSTERPAGGAWKAPVDLTASGQIALTPQVAVDPQGNAVAVWRSSSGASYSVQAAVRPAGGSWQAPVDLSAEGEDALEPQVTLDSQGDAVAVWERSNGANEVVQGAMRPVGGMWQAPVDLSAAGQNAHDPQVAVDPQGNAVAVWRSSSGASYSVQAAVRPAGGSWQAPVDLSAEGEDALEPQVTLDSQGDAVAVWERSNGANEVVQGAMRPVGGMWQAPVDLSAAGQNAHDPQVAVDPQGNAVAVWRSSSGASYSVQAAVRPAGGSWQAPVDLSAEGEDALEPQVTLDSQGDAVAVWERSNGANEVVQGAMRPVGGMWQASVDLSAKGLSGFEPQVALDSQGNAAAIWETEVAHSINDLIQSAGYDAAGPVLDGLMIPTTGTIGEPLSFLVAPFDTWSALGMTNWGFGDGDNESGTSITHTYSAPGNYEVTVNSADALANSSSTTRTITISATPMTTTTTTSTTTTSNRSTAQSLSISAVSLTNTRFRVAQPSTAASTKKGPLGTILRFTLSAVAGVEVTVTRTALGLRSRHSCRKPTALLRREHAKHCARTIIVGALPPSNEPIGADSMPFSGRIANRALKPGSYHMTVSAGSADGHSESVTLPFTIVR